MPKCIVCYKECPKDVPYVYVELKNTGILNSLTGKHEIYQRLVENYRVAICYECYRDYIPKVVF